MVPLWVEEHTVCSQYEVLLCLFVKFLSHLFWLPSVNVEYEFLRTQINFLCYKINFSVTEMAACSSSYCFGTLSKHTALEYEWTHLWY